MSRRNKIFGVGLLFAAMTASTAARADQPPRAEYPACPKIGEGSEEMKRRFNAARTDYEDGSYDSALKRFREVYAADCKPELLLFIAATWEKKRDLWQTLYALELFVERAPKDSTEITPTQNRIESLKKEIARQQQSPPPKATTDPNPPPKTTEPQNEHTIYPWIVAGAGVIAVGVGVALILTANVPPNCNPDTLQCSQREGADLVEDRQAAGNALGRRTAGIITTIGGVAILGGGIAWHFLEPVGPKEKSARLVPAIGPGYAGLGLSGRF